MILKSYTKFKNIKESFDYDELEERKNKAIDYLESEGFYKKNNRYNFDGDFILNSKNYNILVYKGFFLVPLGVILGSLHCSHYNLNSSLENLPTEVGGDLNLNNCHIKSLKNFNTIVNRDFDLSNNHLHKLENIQKVLKGNFDINGNMLTTLEGCPEEVLSITAKYNWIKTLYGAPIRITKYTEGDSRHYTSKPNFYKGGLSIFDDKISKIEKRWYSKQSFYEKDSNTHKGIKDYWNELFKYIIDVTEKDKLEEVINKIKWPANIKGDILRKSLNTVSKFNL